jgi:hypothetical protein
MATIPPTITSSSSQPVPAGGAERIAPEGSAALIARGGKPGGSDRRPSIASIVRQYQVESEPTVKWQPTVLGVWRLGDQPVTVTRTEATMLDNLQFTRGLNGLSLVRDIKKNAELQGARLFGGKEDGYQDAFRHAYASALLTQALGPKWTHAFTTAHEARADNRQGKEAMDLYNNSVGIRIATQYPRANEATLKRLIVNALAKGELLVIGTRGHPCWSNQVSDDNTGEDISDPVNGVLPKPDPNVTPGQ